ncbi:MAG: PAS domain-containing protein [Gemmatimonadaceae bacterium]|nr:PAS domain-containing protein [Gemmatimonadaceae bacterium]
MNHSPSSAASSYGVAFVALAAALLVRWLLGPALGETLPLVTLFAPIAVAVHFGGYRPALLIVVVGYVACAYLFIAPRGQLGLSEPRNVFGLVAYLLTAGVIVGFGEAWRRSEHRASVESLADGFMRFDRKWRITYVNAAAEQITQRLRADLLGKSHWDVFPTAVGTPLEDAYRRAVDDGVAVEFEHHDAPSGRWFAVKGSPLPDRDFAVAFRDISDQKRTADALQRAEQQLRTITDTVPALIAYADADCHYRLNNLAYERWFGRRRGEITGRHMREVLGDDAWALVGPKVAAALAGETVQYEAQVPYADGGMRWIDATYVPSFGPSGDVIGIVVLVHDISERKRSEEQLRQSERRLELVLRSINDHFVTYDREWRYTFVNDRAAAILGRRREELLGRCIWDLFPDAVGNQYYVALHRALAEQQPSKFEHFYEPFDAWFDNHVYPTPDGVSVFAADITARKRAEERLAAANERFELAARATQDGIWDYDPATQDNTWSPRCFELLGLPIPTVPQRVTQAWLTDRMHPDDYAPMWAAADAYWSGRVPHYVTEMRLRHEDGSYRWFLSRGVAIQDEHGRVVRMTGALSDDHDRRVAELALRDSDERFRTAVAATSDILWTNDASGKMLGVQAGWGGFTGQSFDEYQGYGWATALHPDDAQPTITAWDAAVRERRRFTFEHRVRRRDGTYRLCSVRAVPLLDVNGSVREWVGVHTDVTEQRELEQQLKDADRRKDEFLATLAHELRNPLAPIRNGLHILRLAADNVEAVAHTREMMERQLAQMVRLVDDLLDVSRITTGKFQLRMERVNLAIVVRTAVETSRPLISANGHDLRVTVPPMPVLVDADVTRLAQVFANLLNNAAKYSDRGSRILLTVEAGDADVVVSVKDAGAGIPPEMLSQVFEMFTQVDRSLERAQGGLGIGLTLVRRLVEMHGGSVEAHSDGVGQGSEFVVRLPVVASAERSVTPDVDGEPSGRPGRYRVLVADDNSDAATSLASLLTFLGHEVRTANDGLEAVDVTAAFRPDVILLDIGMPKLNGYDACRRIREQPWGETAFVVAATGWGQDEDKRRSDDAGFDTHLVKPVQPAVLERLLASSVGLTR